METPKLALIVAMTANGEIGFENGIPWRLKGDLANFRVVTDGLPVIMGRRTMESLPNGPLTNRINIVVSQTLSTQDGCVPDDDNFVFQPNVPDAIEFAKRYGTDWIFFIGGARIYEEALPLVERVVLTLVHQEGEYDTVVNNFKLPPGEWEIYQQSPTVYKPRNEEGFILPSHTYFDYRRKQ